MTVVVALPAGRVTTVSVVASAVPAAVKSRTEACFPRHATGMLLSTTCVDAPAETVPDVAGTGTSVHRSRTNAPRLTGRERELRCGRGRERDDGEHGQQGGDQRGETGAGRHGTTAGSGSTSAAGSSS